MLTQPPNAAFENQKSSSHERPDDLSGHGHRQVIGYLGLALPILLTWFVKWRPNAQADEWSGRSISAYYWTGGVSLFAGLLAALSLFLLTYRGYRNETYKYDRGAAIIAGIAAAIVALFPTTPPHGVSQHLLWYGDWINKTHLIAAVALFTMFAVFSLWLFRKTSPGEQPLSDKNRRNAIYLLCGIGIVGSMIWALIAGLNGESIFWPESSALIFFAWSWLVKGPLLIRSSPHLPAGATS